MKRGKRRRRKRRRKRRKRSLFRISDLRKDFLRGGTNTHMHNNSFKPASISCSSYAQTSAHTPVCACGC